MTEPHTPEDSSWIDPEFLEILVCPECKTSVSQEGSWLVCSNPDCGLRYPIQDGIPVMLVEEAQRPSPPPSE
jgi:uncharacterized protein YbaR (Trm112 family)